MTEALDLSKLRDGDTSEKGFLGRAQYLNSLPRKYSFQKKVIIFSTPRSGSTFLADQLASTGLVGAPDEWLNPLWLRAVFNSGYASNVTDALDWAASRTSVNNIFSVNVQISHYIFWKKKGFDLLKWGYNDAIYLERNDKIAQAYSLAKARLYNKWEKISSDQGNAQIDNPVPIYAILMSLGEVYYWSEYFEKILKKHTSRTIYYEEYIQDEKIILDLVEQFSGIRPKEFVNKSKFLRQQTGKDKEIIENLKSKILI